MFTLVQFLPATLLAFLLTLVVLTYLWSGNADRRRRARTVVELLVRVDSTEECSGEELDDREVANKPAPVLTHGDPVFRTENEVWGE